MEFTIERGALVTLIQTLLVILFFASHQHVYWYVCWRLFPPSLTQLCPPRLPVHINLTKLYANVFCECGLFFSILA